MKKYIRPEMEVETIHVENMIASSPVLNNSITTASQLSNGRRRNSWDSGWD